MRYRFPDGCRAVVHDGRPLPIAPDGSIELEVEDAERLACHGAVPVADETDSAAPRATNRTDNRRGAR